jgi:hypothetical protein
MALTRSQFNLLQTRKKAKKQTRQQKTFRPATKLTPKQVSPKNGLSKTVSPKNISLKKVAVPNKKQGLINKVIKKYQLDDDKTLTKLQQKNKRFGSANNFRSPSNPTLNNHSSGYHESAVTTDFFNLLDEAKDNNNGTHNVLGKGSNPLFKTQITINSDVYHKVVAAADPFRTDTARTLLSGKNGMAAGHSGSGMDQKGQADAHDLLREAVIRVLQLPGTTKGLSQKSVTALFGAITITSMAPAELAEKVTGTLKDKKAGAEWERNRNESKARLDNIIDTQLSPDEKKFVIAQSSLFMNSTQPSRNVSRKMDTNRQRASSPFREENSKTVTKFSGGSYLDPTKSIIPEPSRSAPTNTSEWGFYLTEPFRAPRQN